MGVWVSGQMDKQVDFESSKKQHNLILGKGIVQKTKRLLFWTWDIPGPWKAVKELECWVQ